MKKAHEEALKIDLVRVASEIFLNEYDNDNVSATAIGKSVEGKYKGVNCLVVLLKVKLADDHEFPDSIEQIPVVYHVIGNTKPQLEMFYTEDFEGC